MIEQNKLLIIKISNENFIIICFISFYKNFILKKYRNIIAIFCSFCSINPNVNLIEISLIKNN